MSSNTENTLQLSESEISDSEISDSGTMISNNNPIYYYVLTVHTSPFHVSVDMQLSRVISINSSEWLKSASPYNELTNIIESTKNTKLEEKIYAVMISGINQNNINQIQTVFSQCQKLTEDSMPVIYSNMKIDLIYKLFDDNNAY
jgi:hypothetical protein